MMLWCVLTLLTVFATLSRAHPNPAIEENASTYDLHNVPSFYRSENAAPILPTPTPPSPSPPPPIYNSTAASDNTEYKVEDVPITTTQPTNATFKHSDDNGGRAGVEARVLYTGAQVWKVPTPDLLVLNKLNTFTERKEIAWWGGNRTSLDMLVKSGSISPVSAVLKQHNIDYEVVVHDLQQNIDNENPDVDEEEELANRKGHSMTWLSYHRVDAIHGYLDYLAATYPNLCSVRTIGTSVQGRPLKVLRISNGRPNQKAIWIDGGMHAREWISPAVVTYMINQIVEGFDAESENMKNTDWYIHPMANPDGYEYSHTTDRLWRKNRARGGQCAGTDLNRNFGYRWGGKGNSKNPCAETFGGTSGFSEPETKAIRDFFDGSGANFKAFLTYHSYGQYILFPWGYDNVVPPDYKDLQNLGDKAAQAMRKNGGASYRVGAAANTLYPASGGSDDWAKSIGIKYAYTFELRDSGRYGFVLPATFITTTAKEAFAALRVITDEISV